MPHGLMQRIFPVRSRNKITSRDNSYRYFAALSSSSACGHGCARESAESFRGSDVVISSFIKILTGDRDARLRTAKSLTIRRRRATFVSSLERGVIGSLLWSTEKSSHRSVVTRRWYV